MYLDYLPAKSVMDCFLSAMSSSSEIQIRNKISLLEICCSMDDVGLNMYVLCTLRRVCMLKPSDKTHAMFLQSCFFGYSFSISCTPCHISCGENVR